MNPHQKDFIVKHLPQLVNCTRDLPLIGLGLLKSGIISENAWEGILLKYPDSVTRILQMYIDLLETSSDFYDFIIDILLNHGNGTAAEILRQIYDTSEESESSSSVSSCDKDNSLSCESLDSTEKYNDSYGEDFRISEQGAMKIKYILENFPRLEEEWMAVQFTMGLSGKSRGELTKLAKRDDKFGNLVFRTIKLWRIEKVKEATFQKFVSIIADYNKVASETLEQKKNEIRTVC